jgi:Peptidase A4 family
MNAKFPGAARAGLGVALAAALAGCGGGAGSTVPAAKEAAQAQSPSAATRAIGAVARSDGGFDVTLMHGAAVPLEFQTQPGAACTTATTKPGHEILADALGNVRVGLRAVHATASNALLVLTCRQNGAVVKTVPLRLTVLAGEAPARSRAARSAPAAVSAGDIEAAKARLGFDFTTASKEQLLAHDLPPRPDLPSAHAGWLRAVTSPTKAVVRSGVPTHARNTNATSRNWSGYSVNGSLHEFSTSSGEWYIPQLYSIDACGIGCYAALWDGIGGSALAQDGTMSYTDVGGWSGGDTGYFVAVDQYYIWYEYFPNASNLAVYAYAGDDVWCETWLSTPSSNASGAAFYCKDNTTGVVVSTTLPFPGGYAYYSDGGTVSWILEAPVVDGSTTPLPDYNTAYLWGAYGATASDGQWFGYSQRSNIVNWTMVNGSTTLSTAAPWSGGTYGIQWTWYNYD